VQLSVGVGDQGQGQGVDAGIAFQGAGGELRQLLVVAGREILADLAQHVLDDVIVVDEPLGFQAPALVPRRRLPEDPPMRPAQHLPVVLEAPQQGAGRPPGRGRDARGGQPPRQGLQVLQAQQLGPDRLLRPRINQQEGGIGEGRGTRGGRFGLDRAHATMVLRGLPSPGHSSVPGTDPREAGGATGSANPGNRSGPSGAEPQVRRTGGLLGRRPGGAGRCARGLRAGRDPSGSRPRARPELDPPSRPDATPPAPLSRSAPRYRGDAEARRIMTKKWDINILEGRRLGSGPGPGDGHGRRATRHFRLTNGRRCRSGGGSCPGSSCRRRRADWGG
jgi:hypothetical protein